MSPILIRGDRLDDFDARNDYTPPRERLVRP
jgi:hypothetical protein